MECKVRANKKSCACRHDDCERHGICCECLRYHLATRSLPACVKNQEWVSIKS